MQTLGLIPNIGKRKKILIASYSTKYFQYFRNLLLDENTLGEENQSKKKKKKVDDNEIFNITVELNALRFSIIIQ